MVTPQDPGSEARLSTLEMGVESMGQLLDLKMGELNARFQMLEEKSDQVEQRMKNADTLFGNEVGKIAIMEAAFKQMGNTKSDRSDHWKPLLESRAIAGLKVLGNERAEYRLWQEKSPMRWSS